MHLFVDNLTNIDFSYLDPVRGLVGETWLASIELDGNLDEQGMVCDFGVVKKTVRQWLDTYLDHCLLVPSMSDHVQWQSNNIDPSCTHISMDWSMTNGLALKTSAPEAAITFVDCTSISPENVANWCVHQLQKLFPNTVSKLSLTFRCEFIDGPFYHYSHGLKKHDGNCQRITHGHRSRLEIWRNGILDAEAMQHWANRWKDIYIGTQADLRSSNNGLYHFEYQARQGHFSLTIPEENCYLMDTDSTVELIAEHIAIQLKNRSPSDHFIVKAYEGIGKGARITR